MTTGRGLNEVEFHNYKKHCPISMHFDEFLRRKLLVEKGELSDESFYKYRGETNNFDPKTDCPRCRGS